MRHPLSVALAAVCLLPVLVAAADALPSYSAFGFTEDTLTFTEDFDTLESDELVSTAPFVNADQADRTLDYWYIEQVTNPDDPVIKADDGEDDTEGFYSYGDSDGEDVTDRALGGQPGDDTGSMGIGVRLVNNTGLPIVEFRLAFTVEQWHEDTEDTVYTFGHRLDEGGDDTVDIASNNGAWTEILSQFPPQSGTEQALDGNDAANRVSYGYNLCTELEDGEGIWFALRILRQGTGDDEGGLSLDDITITAFTAESTDEVFTDDFEWYEEGSAIDDPTANPGSPWTATTASAVTSGELVIDLDDTVQNRREICEDRFTFDSFNDDKLVVGLRVRPDGLDSDGSALFGILRSGDGGVNQTGFGMDRSGGITAFQLYQDGIGTFDVPDLEVATDGSTTYSLVLVVERESASTQTITLLIDPASETSGDLVSQTIASDDDPLDFLLLFSDDGGTNGTVAIDDLVVGATFAAAAPRSPVAVTAGTTSASTVEHGDQDVLVGAFVFDATGHAAPNPVIQTVTLAAQGTGDDDVDVKRVELWLDADADGEWDSTLDTQLDTGVYTASNGELTLDAGDTVLDGSDTQTLFVVYDFNSSFTDGETFRVQLADADIRHRSTITGLEITGSLQTGSVDQTTSETTTDDNGTPANSWVLVLLALVTLAVSRRR